MRIFLSLMLFLASMSFALGLILPLVQLDKLYFFTESPSLIGVIQGLIAEDETMLAIIIGIFSIGFPGVKLALLHVAGMSKSPRYRLLSSLSFISKWSMMDVLLVAIVIYSAKTSGLATAFSLPGLWFYCFATVSSAILTLLFKRLR